MHKITERTALWPGARRLAAAIVLGVMLQFVGIPLGAQTGEADGGLTTNSVGMIFVTVPAGSFSMGAPEGASRVSRPTEVTLDSFLIQTTEVTRAQWRAVTGTEPLYPEEGEDVHELPLNHVNWYEAIAFCNRLSLSEGLEPAYSINGNNDPDDWGTTPYIDYENYTAYGDYVFWDLVTLDLRVDGYRLPTEAEWEYAARGGPQSRGYVYAGSDDANDVAWFHTNEYGGPGPVASMEPNELGLYDMSGNVAEWCWDWGDGRRPPVRENPTGPTWGEARSVRGGGFLGYYDIELQPVWAFGALNPIERGRDIGFRLARSVIPRNGEN